MAALDLHPTFEGNRFTLRGLFTDEAQARANVTKLEEVGIDARLFTQEAPSGRELHHIAARNLVEEQPRARLPHERTPAWEATRVAIEMFRAIARAAERKGIEFRWYKELEEQRLKACVESWHWGGTVEELPRTSSPRQCMPIRSLTPTTAPGWRSPVYTLRPPG